MNFAQWLSAYANLNLLLIVGFGGLGVFAFILRRMRLQISAQAFLRLHYFVLTMIFAWGVIHLFLPSNEVFAPAVKVWSAPSIKKFNSSDVGSANGYIRLSTEKVLTIETSRIAYAWGAIGFLLLCAGFLVVARDLKQLVAIKKNSYLIRRIRHTFIYVSEHVQVPFSFWLPGQANLILPSSLLERRPDFKMAVAHELQHHRQGDTRWLYVMWGLKLICIINPAVYLWNRWIMEIQEFACDETLVDQGKVESQSYIRCLVEVAQTAIEHKHVPVCATGLTFLRGRNLLKRRIVKMLGKTKSQIGRSISVAAAIVLAAFLGATAFAAKGLVQDRRVSMAQAKLMASRAQTSSGFAMVVNDAVLRQLNRYVGTPEGREYMRESLARLENHREVVTESLQKHNLPEELIALPIAESGYKNLPQGAVSSTNKSAGVWQFIPQTARNYGLQVDAQKDERLDIPLSTDAALRYLQSNNLRFKDWHLSALAYNMGENAVQKGINATGSRDAWVLIRNGYEGDKDYLAKVVASVLIMKNPESIRE